MRTNDGENGIDKSWRHRKAVQQIHIYIYTGMMMMIDDDDDLGGGGGW